MANPLKLPFEFPPNTVPATHQVQANFNSLLDFVQNLNDGVQSLTNLVVNTLQTTSTANIGGALTASSTATLNGAVTATSTVVASGLITGNNGVQVNNAALDVNSTAEISGAVTAASTVQVTGDITADATVKLANGSAGAPSLRFTNSTSAGLFRAASNNLAISTDSTTGWEIDADGNVNMQRQPNFLATLGTGVVAVTYTGVENPVIFDTEVFDTASNYSTSTGLFTAPVAGKYYFSSFFPVASGGGSPSTLIEMDLVTTNATVQGSLFSLAAGITVGLVISAAIDLDANDTAKIVVRPTSSTATWVQPLKINFGGIGFNSIRPAYFSGCLLN